MTPENFLETASKQLQAEIDSGNISTAKKADELVSELLAGSNLAIDSCQYDALSAALCEIAGQEFPGDWDDSPKR